MENLNKLIDEVEESLVGQIKEINLYTFNAIYRPVFDGLVEDPDNLIRKWIEIVGGPYREVRIVDNDKEVGKVRGLLQREDIEHKDRSKLGDYLSNIGRLETINPLKAEAMTNDLVKNIEPKTEETPIYVIYGETDVEESTEDEFDFLDM
jgi:hypothetical protein